MNIPLPCDTHFLSKNYLCTENDDFCSGCPRNVSQCHHKQSFSGLRTTLTRTIIIYWLMIWLLGSNHLQNILNLEIPEKREHAMKLESLTESHGIQVIVSLGQKESQVMASWGLVVTCDSVWSRLTWTWNALRWLSSTLIELKFALEGTFGHPTQVNARARLHWNGFLATCVELVSTCKSVWPPIPSLCSQVHIS